jgi:hypothetical protein
MEHTVTITHENITDIIVWANKEFGGNTFRVTSQFPTWAWSFIFNDSKNAMMFALKWL